MTSQWDYFLKNLGQWQGSFTHLSPLGEIMKDVRSVLTLTEVDPRTVRLILQRFPDNQPPQELKLDFTSLNRSLLFCETGAFSQGGMQWSPFSNFGAEFSLIDNDRRLRLVQLYDSNGRLDQLTLIREKRADTNAQEKPPLTLDQLLGKWQGEATTIYASDWYCSAPFFTELIIEQTDSNQIFQQLTYGNGEQASTITSKAIIDGSRLLFNQNNPPRQVLLLPDGASSNCPLEIQSGQGFILELGWLMTPKKRQRLIRQYNSQGEWVSLTLVKEEKIL
ncbi:conserved hypothetical protein [Gloeothece citriformis PCC 7424]|uniref:Uncharacterized protein n=1 Tax=Gloeothece citriformis (strain PCC 7424) TaxID=65393 RepID=B7K6Z0_GLOC7|nr:DUF3598 family protein [Gloeothece citriformis]ACK72689.1 conserved hypothetical protein [Gloeothece citriformis PCC 7424]